MFKLFCKTVKFNQMINKFLEDSFHFLFSSDKISEDPPGGGGGKKTIVLS